MRPQSRFRAVGRGSAAAPARGRTALGEVVLLGIVLLVFTRLHAEAGHSVTAASSHARSIQSAERWLHVDAELASNRWLTSHERFITPAVLVYRLYYAVLIGVMVWLFIRHADVYRRARRTFVAMAGLALLAFWAMPVSPPRFALPGIVDIVAEHDLLGSRSSRDLSPGANHFSAMPSLHVGWSAWCAYAAWSAWRGPHPRAALLAWLFPLAMTAVVLTTGNHYTLDVAGSGVLLIASIAAARGWERVIDRRP